MLTNILKIIIFLVIFFPKQILAIEDEEFFHMFKLESDIAESKEGTLYNWDLDGWIGGDINKLSLKSEGEKIKDKNTEKSTFWAKYSRNIATFWDFQAGFRHDIHPKSKNYFLIGLEGLAPYFFETEAHVFISEDGNLTSTIHQENEFLITQRFIIQPYCELNFSTQDVQDLEIGSGLTVGEFGLQTRYEYTRKFSPYIDIKYERKYGETSIIAQKNNKKNEDIVIGFGIRLMF